MQNKVETINILGIDWGEKRIGLAIGDSETKIASPYKTVSRLNEILIIIKDEKIEQLAIGRPFKMSGDKKDISDQYLNFLNKLKKRVNLPLVEIDERLSSQAADSLEGTKKTKAGRDEIAAMLILQAYFDKF